MQVRLTTTVILAVIFGSVYWQKGMQRSTAQDVNRIAGLQFLAVINLGFNNAFTVLPILSVERGVFYRFCRIALTVWLCLCCAALRGPSHVCCCVVCGISWCSE